MSQIFLSASIPQQGRGDFFESADPFLIQFAVREFMTVCLVLLCHKRLTAFR